MLDFFIIAISMLLGIICPILVNYIFSHKEKKKSKAYNDRNYELNNLLIEKSIALKALYKIEKLSEEEKIDKNEKYNLVLKYNKILDDYNEKILKLKPITEIKDIYEFKNKRDSLKIEDIEKLDKRITDSSTNFGEVNKNELQIGNRESPITMNLKSRNMYRRFKEKFKHNHKSSIDEINKYKKSDLNVLEYKENKPSQSSLTKYGKEEDSTDIDNVNAGKEVYLKNDNIIIDKRTEMKEEREEDNKEEIDKIQKEILKILQRLESSSN